MSLIYALSPLGHASVPTALASPTYPYSVCTDIRDCTQFGVRCFHFLVMETVSSESGFAQPVMEFNYREPSFILVVSDVK